MNHAIKMTALAVFAASFAAPALADKATTKGGFEIKSEDGNFSAKLGGRIHFDGNYVIDEDDLNANTRKTNSTTDFRRARLSVSGQAYDWSYLFENDFAGQGSASGTGFREMWIGKKVLGNNMLRIGQAKPFRGMEELTSSNDITFMERPFASATGIYNKQFTQGVFLNGTEGMFGYGVSVYNNKQAGDADTQGLGYNGRAYLFPVNANGTTLHLGVSASADNYDITVGSPTVGIVDGAPAVIPGADIGGPSRSARITRKGGLSQSIVSGSDAFSSQNSYAAELAFQNGPLVIQGEYALSSFEDSKRSAGARDDQDVEAYYVQASFFLTDHAKRYNTGRGAFGNPSVKAGAGAVELKARFDSIENKDAANKAEASYFTVGVNYYATPNTRFMLEYTDGNAKTAAVGTTAATDRDLSAITARAQFNF